MFKNDLKQKYPFLTEYFEQGIANEKRSIAHSILFYGSDVNAQYDLALEIARNLNCLEDKSENCNCLNCRWIRENSHPAVLTISKIDNKEADDSKTVISVKQAKFVKNSLLTTSQYHRVFIFCDAEIVDGNRVNLGLNKTNFQEETANSLLKIIEEPPNNTTFFFLTRDKNDLIETIISRSQSFLVPSLNKDLSEYKEIEDIFENYPNLDRQSSFSLSANLYNLTKNTNPIEVLTNTQKFIENIMLSNLDNKILQIKLRHDIQAVETAKNMILKKVSPQTAIDNMFLELT